MKNVILTGSIPALITPFAEDESIDLAHWKKWITWHDHQASRSVVIFGSTGEGISLTESERSVLLKSARKSLQSTGMIVGVSSPSTDMAVAQALEAKAHGAQAILLTTPCYVRPDQNGLYQHFEKVAQAVKLPVILYTVPSRTGVDFTEDTIIKLAQNPYIVAIKDASSQLDRMQRLVAKLPAHFIYLGGNDHECFENLDRNGDGTISVIANVVPNLFQSIIGNYQSNQQWAKGHFASLKPMLDQLSQHGNPQVIKHMVEFAFSLPATLRLPLTALENSVQTAIHQSLQACDISPEEIAIQ